jgi:hypothetical protein
MHVRAFTALGVSLQAVSQARSRRDLPRSDRPDPTSRRNLDDNARASPRLTLQGELKAVPAPNTSEGRTAKKGIDRQLITSAQGESNSAQTVASTIVANAGNMTQVVAALAALPDYQTLKATTQQTLTLSATGSLASAFKSEQDCKHLG